MKKFTLTFLLLFSLQVSAGVVEHELSPDVLLSAKSTMISLKEIHEDGSKVDVTSQYVFTYEDPEPTKTEIKVSLFNGKPVLFSTIAGTDYVIKATKKDNTSFFHLKTVKVNPGAAFKSVIFSGNNQTGFGGETVNPLMVKVVDSYGNPVAGTPIKWTNPAGQSTDIPSDSNGISSFSYTLGNAAGTEKVSAELAGKTPAVFSLTVKALTSSLTKIAFTSNQISTEQNKIIPQLKVGLYDGNNQLMTTASRTVIVAPYINSSCTTPASGTLSGTKSVESINGVASFSDLKYDAIGSIYLKSTASTGEISCSRVVVVSTPIGEGSALTVVAPSSVNANNIMFPYPKVSVVDSNGQVVKASQVPVTVSSYSDSACSVPTSSPVQGINQSITNSFGYVLFQKISTNASGVIYLKAESAGLESACSGAIEVKPDISAVVTRLSFGGLKMSGVKGQIYSFSVNVLNKYGVRIQSSEDEVEVSSHSDSNCAELSSVSLIGSIKVKAKSGIANFDDITYSDVGSVYFKAQVGDVTTCSMAAITFSEPPVQEGVGTKLIWGQYPSWVATINSPLENQPRVHLAGSNNYDVAGTILVTIELYDDGYCSVKSGISQSIWSDNLGHAKFSNISINKLGKFSFKAFSGKIVSDCSYAVTVGCPIDQHEEGGVCVNDEYIYQYTEWSPKQNELNESSACSGYVPAERRLRFCLRRHDQVDVDHSYCPSPELSTSWPSPYAIRSVSGFENGHASEECLVGQTNWNIIAISCNAGYGLNSSNECKPIPTVAEYAGPDFSEAGKDFIASASLMTSTEPHADVVFVLGLNNTCNWARITPSGEIYGTPSDYDKRSCILSYRGDVKGTEEFTNTVSKRIEVVPSSLLAKTSDLSGTWYDPHINKVNGDLLRHNDKYLIGRGGILFSIADDSSINQFYSVNQPITFKMLLHQGYLVFTSYNMSIKKYDGYNTTSFATYGGFDMVVGHDGRLYFASNNVINGKQHGNEPAHYNGVDVVKYNVNTTTYSCSFGCNSYSSDPEKFFVLNGYTYFVAKIGQSRNMDGIYRADGTNSPVLAEDFTTGAGTFMNISSPFIHGGYAYFSTDTDSLGRRFARFNGNSSTFLYPNGNYNINIQFLYNGQHFALDDSSKILYRITTNGEMIVYHNFSTYFQYINPGSFVSGLYLYVLGKKIGDLYQNVFIIDMGTGEVSRLTNFPKGVDNIAGSAPPYLYISVKNEQTTYFDLHAVRLQNFQAF